jgi:hypothetical protein
MQLHEGICVSTDAVMTTWLKNRLVKYQALRTLPSCIAQLTAAAASFKGCTPDRKAGQAESTRQLRSTRLVMAVSHAAA